MSESLDTPTSPATAWRWQALLCFLPIAFLWVVLINHLRVEWTVNAQYNYGWAVPFLCAYLAWQASRAPGTSGLASIFSTTLFKISWALLLLLSLLYLPTRLVQEANPDWRLVSWALAIIVVGLTLVFVHRVFGLQVLRWTAFPVVFFFVAVPWPTLIEEPLIRRLAEFNAIGAVEILNLIGLPALRHGNVIEISTGLVGIEDACSGIRSFQACLMIGLFLGAFNRLRTSRRLELVIAGFLLAILFNLGRTILLVGVAAKQGIPAIAKWHDPAGVTILVGCFLGVWALAALFARRAAVPAEPPVAALPPPSALPLPQRRVALALASGLFLWVVACEAGVQFWYARHESQASTRATWTVHLPGDAPQFHEVPFAPVAVQMLRFDEGRNAAWVGLDGLRYQAIFLHWHPGRIAVNLARSHTPEVCLTASGRKLADGPAPQTIVVDGLALKFDVYHAEGEGLWVYYCLWEDGVASDSNETEHLTYGNRLRPVLEGRRNSGQRSLELAVWSTASPDEIHSRMAELIPSLVQVHSPSLYQNPPSP